MCTMLVLLTYVSVCSMGLEGAPVNDVVVLTSVERGYKYNYIMKRLFLVMNKEMSQLIKERDAGKKLGRNPLLVKKVQQILDSSEATDQNHTYSSVTEGIAILRNIFGKVARGIDQLYSRRKFEEEMERKGREKKN